MWRQRSHSILAPLTKLTSNTAIQLWKRKHPQYSKLPIKEAEADPWTEVHVDMMGPLSVTTPTKKLSLLVFTAIDPATGWFECIEVPNKESFTVMEAFNNHWLLSQYPRPQRICFDNGTEFKSVFQEMCSNYGLKAKPTTTYNPRSNGIVERVHQTLRDNLATFELSNRELPEYFYPLQHGLLEVLFILLSKPLQASWYLEEICY
jgi:IS30 family transposase